MRWPSIQGGTRHGNHQHHHDQIYFAASNSATVIKRSVRPWCASHCRMSDDAFATTGQKRRRTRSGCLNCRRKRKKCRRDLRPVVSRLSARLNPRESGSDHVVGDETRPTCLKCERSGENCQWDALIKFRPPTGVCGSRDSTPAGPVTLRIGSDYEVGA